MKIISQSLFAVILLMIGFPFVQGQNQRPGFLISEAGDTITGMIGPLDIWVNWEVEQNFEVTDFDGEKKTYKAKEIKRYGVALYGNADKSKWKRYYAKVWPHNSNRNFVSPIEDGKAQLFLIPDPEVPRNFKSANTLVFQTESQDSRKKVYYLSLSRTEFIVRLDGENYIQVIQQLLRNCPEITDRLGKKGHRFRDLENIIAAYNDRCP